MIEKRVIELSLGHGVTLRAIKVSGSDDVYLEAAIFDGVRIVYKEIKWNELASFMDRVNELRNYNEEV